MLIPTLQSLHHLPHLSFQLPVVVNEYTEFVREVELGGEVIRGGVVVKGLLQQDQLGGSVHVVLWRRGGGGRGRNVAVLGG